MTGHPDSNNEGSVQRWVGFTCPQCHAVFRVPSGNLGRIAKCPVCSASVRLAGKGGNAVSSAGAARETAVAGRELPLAGGGSPPEGVVRRRRPGWGGAGQEVPSWEEQESSSGARDGTVFFLVILGGLLFLLAGVGVLLKANMRSQPATAAENGEAPLGTSLPELAQDPESTGGTVELIEEMASSEGLPVREELQLARAAAERFLRCDDEQELLSLIRARPGIEARVRAHHATHPLEPTPFQEIDLSKSPSFLDSFVSILVKMEDYSYQSIALQRTEEGYLVDWDSWAGYCEVPWSEILKVRPTEPTLMRVIVSEVDYYNFEFSEDREWQAFRLVDESRDQKLYGYVPRASVLARMLRPLPSDPESRAMVLRIRFPEDSAYRDQVFIDELVCIGWVEPDAEEQAPNP